MKTLAVKLPEELYAELATAAAKRDESKSCLVREAIASYMRDDGGRDADLSCDVWLRIWLGRSPGQLICLEVAKSI